MGGEIAVVRAVKSGVMPNSLQGVEFRRISRKVGDFQIFAVI